MSEVELLECWSSEHPSDMAGRGDPTSFWWKERGEGMVTSRL